MPRPSITGTLRKEIFEKNKKTWYSTGELRQILDERYAISVEAKNLAKTLILMTRNGFLIRQRKEKGRDYLYKYRTEKD